MELEQSWEALDVDDSDIPSLLRPCKRRHTLTIPGPAKAVQSAMLRETLDRQNQNLVDNNANGLISTQEYVRKAIEDTAEFDDDFTRLPWLSAIQFLGAGEGVIPSTPISFIKRCSDIGEADRVIAVIKSCTTSGLGGLMLTLKDPTGTVGASIHHKVLCESEFRKNITVGSVLILEKVAIFSPVRSNQYLNITLRNLVKVFCQESDSLSAQTIADNPAHNSHPAVECIGKANTLEKTLPTQSIEIEDSAYKKRLNKGRESLIEKQIFFPKTSQSNNSTSSNLSAAMEIGHSELSQDPFHETPANESDIVSSIRSVANSGTNEGNDEEIQVTNGAEMKGQSLILKPSLPQWTDEQLDELFASDENGGSLV